VCVRLHLTAIKSFKDQFGKDHKAGEEYMVTRETCESFIPDVNETITRTVNATVLNHRQFWYAQPTRLMDLNSNSLLP